VVPSDLIDSDNLWSSYGCWVAEVNCENKHAILHLGVDVGRLVMGIRESNVQRTATNLSMRWDM
jgi:hypothetical protein